MPWNASSSSMLYLIEILHQTTTEPLEVTDIFRCILSKFYIKPQRLGRSPAAVFVVSYRNSTSNHNWIQRLLSLTAVVSYRNSTSNHNTKYATKLFAALYLIEILHQTTTQQRPAFPPSSCILSKFYIKPQQPAVFFVRQVGCILSKFYIKPQLHRHHPKDRKVVSYRNSTSNHNSRTWSLATDIVVSYRNSTSNHN